jgi:histidine triad (HIT) family protein
MQKKETDYARLWNHVSRFTLSLARSSVFGTLLSWIITHMSFFLPVERLYETTTLFACRHPRPDYPLHILLVSKRALKSLADLTADDADFLTELFETVQILIDRFDLEAHGYRLVANGGAYEDVPHLHFHLISDLEEQKP